jgi:hypothetical protein
MCLLILGQQKNERENMSRSLMPTKTREKRGSDTLSNKKANI